ncbi:MAG TPA: hypothetical protein VJZ27_11540 [Aggregatilineales bacterium]|nr:hypothetical protein [Aggregatilineales bacterium]
MKKIIAILFVVLHFSALPVFAQSGQVLELQTDGIQIKLFVPDGWGIEDNADDSMRLEARSTVRLKSENTQRVVLHLDELAAPYGVLPEGDPVGAFMELQAAILPISGEFKPDEVSEVARFAWDNYSAAVFIGYDRGEASLPDYYARWFGIKISETQILLIEQGTTLSPGDIPNPGVLSEFDAMLGSLLINGTSLDATHALQTLNRVTDPLLTGIGGAASLRLSDAVELRISAPSDWNRRNVTRSADFPGVFFFEQDFRQLEEGESAGGAVIQVSLLSSRRLRSLLNVDELPFAAPGDLALAYLNTLLPENTVDSMGNPVEFEWTEDVYAVLLPVLYADGTAQHLLLLEIGNQLAFVTLYAPESRWDSMLATWRSVLASLTINGELMSSEPLESALLEASFSTGQ